MFEINGVKWNIEFVPVTSPFLTRSDGSQSVGVTDANTSTVYLSNRLKGAFLRRVTAHELCHCFCFSFNIHMPMEQGEPLRNRFDLFTGRFDGKSEQKICIKMQKNFSLARKISRRF